MADAQRAQAGPLGADAGARRGRVVWIGRRAAIRCPGARRRRRRCPTSAGPRARAGPSPRPGMLDEERWERPRDSARQRCATARAAGARTSTRGPDAPSGAEASVPTPPMTHGAPRGPAQAKSRRRSPRSARHRGAATSAHRLPRRGRASQASARLHRARSRERWGPLRRARACFQALVGRASGSPHRRDSVIHAVPIWLEGAANAFRATVASLFHKPGGERHARRSIRRSRHRSGRTAFRAAITAALPPPGRCGDRCLRTARRLHRWAPSWPWTRRPCRDALRSRRDRGRSVGSGHGPSAADAGRRRPVARARSARRPRAKPLRSPWAAARTLAVSAGAGTPWVARSRDRTALAALPPSPVVKAVEPPRTYAGHTARRVACPNP